MAEAVQTAIVDLAVKKLVNKGYGSINYMIDLESELKRLQNTRTLIEAALLDADSMSEHYNLTQQNTLEKLNCQLDRLLDLLDVRATRKLQKQVMSGVAFTKELRYFFSASNQLVARFKDARKVEDIKKKLNSIAIDHAMIGRICCLPAHQTHERSIQRVGSPHILTNLVVGRDKDRDQIVSMLSEYSMASGTLVVASIVGIGGMGKTTLAWYVYNDEWIKCCFDVQFWVSATRDFDIKKVLETMIASGNKESPPNLCNMAQLYHQFRQVIGGKKFLLVLDNIWDQTNLRDKWLELRKLLELGANGSKVLITTRDLKVAGVMDSNDPYKLGDLTKDDSWLLFQNIAFTQWQEPGVEAIGKEIVKMCPKVPLVLRSIGGLLAGKRTAQQWQAFRDDQLANFASYGRDVIHTLKFSYDQLDASLKLCVTYCALFEKGGEILKDEMIHRWIALGYVKPAYEKQSLEEAGDEYMISLHNCGFLQLSSYDDPCSFLEYFKMQDVVYELLLTLGGFKYKVADSNTEEIDQRVRHLSFWKSCFMKEDWEEYWEVPSSASKFKHLQSLVRGSPLYRAKLKVSSLSSCDKLTSRLYRLRVLDMQDMGIKELPTSLGELTHLRFLNLSGTDLVKLPHSITRLVNLQSLYMQDCDDLEELPRDMSKLINLRHLKLLRSLKLSYMPTGLGNLTNLKTLDKFVVGEQIGSEATVVGKLADLNQLNNLSGELIINVHRESKYIISSEISAVNLKMKKNLLEMYINFKYGTKEDERVLEGLQPSCNLKFFGIYGYGGEKLPGWMMNRLESHLPNLIVIKIENCNACKYLCSFGRLPHLKRLYLDGLDELEYVEDTIDNSNMNNSDIMVVDLSPTPLFPSLVEFHVHGIPKLKGWWRTSPSSSEQGTREFLQAQQHQRQPVVNWKPPFPKLHSLRVENVEMAIAIARQHLGGFTFVEHIDIGYLHHHQSTYSQPHQALTLPLSSCFPNLRRLSGGNMGRSDLPEEIQDLSSLQSIKIYGCDQIKAIPEWINRLNSLEILDLAFCPKLESLPRQIRDLPNLKTLRILMCPILRERCQSPNGEYWPYIQHIPQLYIP